MALFAIFVKPPPPRTLVVKGTVSSMERDQETGALTVLEIRAGEADFLVNMAVPEAKTAPPPVFQEGEAVAIKLTSPQAAQGKVVGNYLATVQAGP